MEAALLIEKVALESLGVFLAKSNNKDPAAAMNLIGHTLFDLLRVVRPKHPDELLKEEPEEQRLTERFLHHVLQEAFASEKVFFEGATLHQVMLRVDALHAQLVSYKTQRGASGMLVSHTAESICQAIIVAAVKCLARDLGNSIAERALQHIHPSGMKTSRVSSKVPA